MCQTAVLTVTLSPSARRLPQKQIRGDPNTSSSKPANHSLVLTVKHQKRTARPTFVQEGQCEASRDLGEGLVYEVTRRRTGHRPVPAGSVRVCVSNTTSQEHGLCLPSVSWGWASSCTFEEIFLYFPKRSVLSGSCSNKGEGVSRKHGGEESLRVWATLSGKHGDPELGWGTWDPLDPLVQAGSVARRRDLAALLAGSHWEACASCRVGRVSPQGSLSGPTPSLPAGRTPQPIPSVGWAASGRCRGHSEARGPLQGHSPSRGSSCRGRLMPSSAPAPEPLLGLQPVQPPHQLPI